MSNYGALKNQPFRRPASASREQTNNPSSLLYGISFPSHDYFNKRSTTSHGVKQHQHQNHHPTTSSSLFTPSASSSVPKLAPCYVTDPLRRPTHGDLHFDGMGQPPSLPQQRVSRSRIRHSPPQIYGHAKENVYGHVRSSGQPTSMENMYGHVRSGARPTSMVLLQDYVTTPTSLEDSSSESSSSGEEQDENETHHCQCSCHTHQGEQESNHHPHHEKKMEYKNNQAMISNNLRIRRSSSLASANDKEIAVVAPSALPKKHQRPSSLVTQEQRLRNRQKQDFCRESSVENVQLSGEDLEAAAKKQQHQKIVLHHQKYQDYSCSANPKEDFCSAEARNRNIKSSQNLCSKHRSRIQIGGEQQEIDHRSRNHSRSNFDREHRSREDQHFGECVCIYSALPTGAKGTFQQPYINNKNEYCCLGDSLLDEDEANMRNYNRHSVAAMGPSKRRLSHSVVVLERRHSHREIRDNSEEKYYWRPSNGVPGLGMAVPVVPVPIAVPVPVPAVPDPAGNGYYFLRRSKERESRSRSRQRSQTICECGSGFVPSGETEAPPQKNAQKSTEGNSSSGIKAATSSAFNAFKQKLTRTLTSPAIDLGNLKNKNKNNESKSNDNEDLLRAKIDLPRVSYYNGMSPGYNGITGSASSKREPSSGRVSTNSSNSSTNNNNNYYAKNHQTKARPLSVHLDNNGVNIDKPPLNVNEGNKSKKRLVFTKSALSVLNRGGKQSQTLNPYERDASPPKFQSKPSPSKQNQLGFHRLNKDSSPLGFHRLTDANAVKRQTFHPGVTRVPEDVTKRLSELILNHKHQLSGGVGKSATFNPNGHSSMPYIPRAPIPPPPNQQKSQGAINRRDSNEDFESDSNYETLRKSTSNSALKGNFYGPASSTSHHGERSSKNDNYDKIGDYGKSKSIFGEKHDSKIPNSKNFDDTKRRNRNYEDDDDYAYAYDCTVSPAMVIKMNEESRNSDEIIDPLKRRSKSSKKKVLTENIYEEIGEERRKKNGKFDEKSKKSISRGTLDMRSTTNSKNSGGNSEEDLSYSSADSVQVNQRIKAKNNNNDNSMRNSNTSLMTNDSGYEKYSAKKNRNSVTGVTDTGLRGVLQKYGSKYFSTPMASGGRNNTESETNKPDDTDDEFSESLNRSYLKSSSPGFRRSEIASKWENLHLNSDSGNYS